MPDTDILQRISKKETDKEQIADEVIKNPNLLDKVLKGMDSEEARVRYGCAKVIRIISEKEPSLLYPVINLFIEMLDNENNIFKWEGIHVIGNLAKVDSEDKINKIFKKYFNPISGPTLITAGNIVGGAAKIAQAKPELREKITKELLKVEKATYQTDECRNIALGQVINAYDNFFEEIENKDAVVALIKRQLKNSRNATRKKAEKFLKRHKIPLN